MNSKINVLLADDSEEDAFFLKRAFIKQGVNAPFQVVTSGGSAISYLAGQDQFGDRQKFPLPNLMMLDLKMPGTDGFEVLRWLRRQPGLRQLPVIVYSSSVLQGDIDQAYDLGANAYVVKALDAADQQALVEGIDKFWLRPNQFPSTTAPEGQLQPESQPSGSKSAVNPGSQA